MSSDCSRFSQLHCLSQFNHQGHCKQFLISRFILTRDKYLLPFIPKLWRNLQCSVLTLHGYGILQLIYHLKEIRGQSCILKNVASNIRAAAAAKSLQSCPTLCDPIDGSPSGSPIPGILQARTLEWVAISSSNA